MTVPYHCPKESESVQFPRLPATPTGRIYQAVERRQPAGHVWVDS